MSPKRWVKTMVVGPPGRRARDIRRGLLKGLKFYVNTDEKSMRLLALDESEITGDVRRLVAGAATALDIGSNDGWYSLYFASLPHIQAVYSFEPDLVVAAAQKENFALNDPAFSAKTRMFPKMVGNLDDEKWISVDSLLPQLVSPVLMKIDVDGGELAVLEGAKNTLRERECFLVIETHTPELERDCIAYLNQLEFETRIIKPAWYRMFVPEARSLAHNQWFVATAAKR